MTADVRIGRYAGFVLKEDEETKIVSSSLTAIALTLCYSSDSGEKQIKYGRQVCL